MKDLLTTPTFHLKKKKERKKERVIRDVKGTRPIFSEEFNMNQSHFSRSGCKLEDIPTFLLDMTMMGISLAS